MSGQATFGDFLAGFHKEHEAKYWPQDPEAYLLSGGGNQAVVLKFKERLVNH